MPVTSSGQIGLIADIAAEFTDLGSSNVSMSAAATAAGLSAGEIQMTDFYGLSDVSLPTVSGSASSSVTSSSFTANANVTNDGGGTITERGFYIGTSTTATSNTKYTVSGTTGSYTYSISGLSGSTTYYVHPFATNSAGTTIASYITTTTAVALNNRTASITSGGIYSQRYCNFWGSWNGGGGATFGAAGGGSTAYTEIPQGTVRSTVSLSSSPMAVTQVKWQYATSTQIAASAYGYISVPQSATYKAVSVSRYANSAGTSSNTSS